MRLWLLNVEGTVVLLARYFCARNKRVGVFDLAFEAVLVVTIYKAYTKATINLNCLSLDGIKQY